MIGEWVYLHFSEWLEKEVVWILERETWSWLKWSFSSTNDHDSLDLGEADGEKIFIKNSREERKLSA